MSEPVCELPRFIEASKVNVPQTIVANEAECAAIAERLALDSLSLLEAKLELKNAGGRLIRVTGELRAKLTQTCVVTLEPFDTEVAEPIEDSFTDDDPSNWDMDDPEAPGEIINGKIDLGELIIQTLSLALDPYPRKPGVEFSGYDK